MASRKITCIDCGRVKPTPHEDAALGLYERHKRGILRGSATCDYCGKELNKGDEAVALTIPMDYREWESTYLQEIT